MQNALIPFLRSNARWLSAGVLLTFLSSFGQTYFISIFSGEIRSSFGLSHGEWGGIYTLGTAASAIVMVWAGALTDKYRVRALGGVVLLGLALACLAMAFNRTAGLLVFVIFALRFAGQGMSSHLAVVAMARWFVATRGRALSVATLGFSFGEALMPILFVGLMTVMDWRILWIIAAGFAVAGIPILAGLLRQERTPQSMAAESHSTGMQSRHWTRRQTLGHPLFWFMVPALLGPSAFGTAFFFHQVHFAAIKGWAHTELVALFPLYTIASISVMILTGWALDRFGTPRLIPFYQLPMVAGFFVFSQAETLTMAAVGFLAMAMTTGANATLPNAFWAEFYGTRNLGSIKAMAAAVMVLGSAIGPGITGLLIDKNVGLETQFVWIAAYFLLTTTLMAIGVRAARQSL